MSPTILFLGASKGCGFYALIHLLTHASSAKAVLLLRKPDALDLQPEYNGLSEEQKSRVVAVKGDATNAMDVEEAFKKAEEEGDFQIVVSSLGAAATISWTGQVKLDQPSLTTDSTLVLLPILKSYNSTSPNPKKLVVVSSMGIGHKAHQQLPFALKFLYGHLLAEPHKDKLAMEVLLSRSLVPSASSDGHPRHFPHPNETDSKFLPETSLSSSPTSFLQPQNLLVVRPALLTDGVSNEDKVRFDQEGELKGAYTVSRRSVGGWIGKVLVGQSSDAQVDGALRGVWGKQVVLAN